MLDAAEWYVTQLRMAPVPLYGLSADGACQCGRPGCEARGKHPRGDAWQKRASEELDVVRDRFRGHTGNIGLLLAGSGRIVIDADGTSAVDLVESWGLPATLRAQSGSGRGSHWVYDLGPSHSAQSITDRRVYKGEGWGVDVKVRGQFVVAPSRHASGGIYTWTHPVPVAVLPDEVYQRISRHSDPPSATRLRTAAAPVAPNERSRLYARAVAYLAKVDQAVSGEAGHQRTFAAARSLWAWVQKGLPEADALAILANYNARCEPPWTDRELAHKWSEAQKAHRLPALEDRPRLSSVPGGASLSIVSGGPPASARPPPPPPPPPPSPPGGGSAPDWRAQLLWADSRNGVGRVISHSDNVTRILQLHPAWRGKIRFDEFRSRITLAADAPWDEYAKPTAALGYWTDADTTRLCGWMRREFHGYSFDPKIADCDRSVQVVARTHDYHPLRDWLDSLAWDGVSRLRNWTNLYLGTEDTEYQRMVGAWWLLSAVARVYEPGCKVDTVPILEGRQGLKKSTLLTAIAGDEYVNDTPIDLGTKDAYTAIQGCWFVELAELESLMRTEPSKSKAFFSSGRDRFRRPYARHESEERRQCVFVGTVNLGEYLQDPTGGRRFHPIRCGRVNLDGLRRDREQLWAEAVHEYQHGRLWYPTTDAEEAVLEPEQEARTKGDAWEDVIASYLERTAVDTVSMQQVLESAIVLDRKDWSTAVQTRVGIILMSRLHWQKRRVRISEGRRQWVYERPVATVRPEGVGHENK